MGLGFALRWSEIKGFLAPAVRAEMEALLEEKAFPCRPDPDLDPMPAGIFRRLLSLDKKTGSEGKVAFVFLRGWGRPLVRAVDPADFEKAARREGWVR